MVYECHTESHVTLHHCILLAHGYELIITSSWLHVQHAYTVSHKISIQ